MHRRLARVKRAWLRAVGGSKDCSLGYGYGWNSANGIACARDRQWPSRVVGVGRAVMSCAETCVGKGGVREPARCLPVSPF